MSGGERNRIEADGVSNSTVAAGDVHLRKGFSGEDLVYTIEYYDKQKERLIEEKVMLSVQLTHEQAKSKSLLEELDAKTAEIERLKREADK